MRSCDRGLPMTAHRWGVRGACKGHGDCTVASFPLDEEDQRYILQNSLHTSQEDDSSQEYWLSQPSTLAIWRTGECYCAKHHELLSTTNFVSLSSSALERPSVIRRPDTPTRREPSRLTIWRHLRSKSCTTKILLSLWLAGLPNADDAEDRLMVGPAGDYLTPRVLASPGTVNHQVTLLFGPST